MILSHYPLTVGWYWWLWKISWGVNPYFYHRTVLLWCIIIIAQIVHILEAKKWVKNTTSPQNSANDKRPWNHWPRLHYKRFLEKKKTEKKHCWVRFDVNPSWLSLDFSHMFKKRCEEWCVGSIWGHRSLAESVFPHWFIRYSSAAVQLWRNFLHLKGEPWEQIQCWDGSSWVQRHHYVPSK